MRIEPRLALVTALGAALAGACTAPEGGSGRQPPRLAFAATAHDAGRVRQGDAIATAFAFRNAGDLPLVLEPPRVGCDCEATASARTLPPGAEGTIDVRCTAGQTSGPLTRTVTVYANDPGQPATTLALTAEVQPVAIADPPAVYLGHVRRGEAVTAAVKLLVPRDAEGAFGPVEVSGGVVRASLGPLAARDAPADMRGQLLRLAIAPDAPTGTFATTLRIPTGRAVVPFVTVAVGGIVDGAVVASPARLDFDRVTPAAEATRVFEVRSTTDRAVTVTGARLEPAVGRVDLEALRPGRVYRVTARVGGSGERRLPAGRLEGTVVIETDAPETARLEVPFTARVVRQ